MLQIHRNNGRGGAIDFLGVGRPVLFVLALRHLGWREDRRLFLAGALHRRSCRARFARRI